MHKRTVKLCLFVFDVTASLRRRKGASAYRARKRPTTCAVLCVFLVLVVLRAVYVVRRLRLYVKLGACLYC